MSSPAVQIKNALIDYLRNVAGNFTLPIPAEQIRGILDISGTPKDAYGIIVNCADLGDHFGNTGRVLVDCKPTICVYTHLDEDKDGTLLDSLAGDVLESVLGIMYSLDGWRVCWRGNWQTSGLTIDGAYRQVELSATLPLNRI
jgi:hypothetical protein